MTIEEPIWKCFDIEHSITSYSDLKEVRTYINNQIQNANGLYVYKDLSDNVLYIGKGKPIKNRIYSHLIEVNKQVSGDRTGKWHRFFNKHHGKLKVYWIELEDESVRKFVEHVLTEVYRPKFLTFETLEV